MVAADYIDRFWIWLRREIRWRWLGFVLVLLTAWFAWHALHGSRGLYAYLDQRRTVQLLQAQLAEFEQRRAALKQHQRLLSDQKMDADLVEEELLDLGWIRSGEVFVPDQPTGE